MEYPIYAQPERGQRSTTNRSRTRMLGIRAVMERYGVSDRSIDRWTANPDLGFPKPTYILRRRFWPEAELDAFDKRQRSA
jgi:predicted DNA-binding transcriptional regulator AlpA